MRTAVRTASRIIDFLVSRSRGFIEEMGGAYDPRHMPMVRPRLPEPAIAKSIDQEFTDDVIKKRSMT